MNTAPHIVVVGSINADLVVQMRRLPMRGETVSAGLPLWLPGGKGANQAVAAARAGAKVTMIGAIGTDSAGEVATSGLRGAGIDLSALTLTAEVPTSIALVLVEETGENQIVVADGANRVVEVPADIVAAADAVICQLEIGDEPLLAAAQAAKGLFVLNAAPARAVPKSVMDRVDVLVVNETEFEALGRPDSGLVVLTLGAKGAMLLRDGIEIHRAAAPAVSVMDTVGAGDTFVGYFVTALASGMTPEQAVDRAVVAGALAVTSIGAQSAIPLAAAVDEQMP